MAVGDALRYLVETPVRRGYVSPNAPAGRALSGFGEQIGTYGEFPDELGRSLLGSAERINQAPAVAAAQGIDWLFRDPAQQQGMAPTAQAAAQAPQPPAPTSASASAPTPAPPPEMTLEQELMSDPAYAAQINAGRAEEARRHDVRAVRMPGGQYTFTNVPSEYRGLGVDVGLGGGVEGWRAGMGSAPESPKPARMAGDDFSPRFIGPATGTDTSSLVARAAMNARLGSRGAVSMMEPTEDQSDEIAIRRLAGATALARAQTARDVASMSPVDQARLANPNVIEGQFTMEQFGPQIDRIQKKVQAKIAILSDPNDPQFVADEKERVRAIRQVQEEGEAEMRATALMLSAMSGRNIYSPQ